MEYTYLWALSRCSTSMRLFLIDSKLRFAELLLFLSSTSLVRLPKETSLETEELLTAEIIPMSVIEVFSLNGVESKSFFITDNIVCEIMELLSSLSLITISLLFSSSASSISDAKPDDLSPGIHNNYNVSIWFWRNYWIYNSNFSYCRINLFMRTFTAFNAYFT